MIVGLIINFCSAFIFLCLQTSESANLDFENINTYIIRIVAKDSGKPAMSCEKSVTVRVQDENEAPRNIRLSANKVTSSPTSVSSLDLFKIHFFSVNRFCNLHRDLFSQN